MMTTMIMNDDNTNSGQGLGGKEGDHTEVSNKDEDDNKRGSENDPSPHKVAPLESAASSVPKEGPAFVNAEEPKEKGQVS